jgi:hypothetical protein
MALHKLALKTLVLVVEEIVLMQDVLDCVEQEEATEELIEGVLEDQCKALESGIALIPIIARCYAHKYVGDYLTSHFGYG